MSKNLTKYDLTCFPCPKCGAAMLVKRTTPAGDGTIRRLRECKWCDHRVNTVERVSGAKAKRKPSSTSP